MTTMTMYDLIYCTITGTATTAASSTATTVTTTTTTTTTTSTVLVPVLILITAAITTTTEVLTAASWKPCPEGTNIVEWFDHYCPAASKQSLLVLLRLVIRFVSTMQCRYVLFVFPLPFGVAQVRSWCERVRCDCCCAGGTT